jgi:hypothetical protein
MLYERVDIGQHGASRALVVALRCARRYSRVRDKTRKHASHVGAVFGGLVPDVPGISGPRCKRRNIWLADACGDD